MLRPHFANMLALHSHIIGLMAVAMLRLHAPALPQAPNAAVSVRIEQPRGQDCQASASVGADVQSLSGGQISVGLDGATSVRISVQPNGDRLSLELDFDGESLDETRRLEVADCATLGRAAALIIAVTLAPIATSAVVAVPSAGAGAAPVLESAVSIVELPGLEPPVSPSGPDATPPAAPRDTDDDARFGATTSSARPRSSDRWRAAAWVGPTVATQPSLGAVLGAEVGPRWGRLRLVLGGWHAFAAQRVDAGVGARAAVSAGEVGLRLSIAAGSAEIELGTGLAMGVMTGSGVGPRVTGRPVTAPWSAATFGAGFAWPARGRVALLARVDAMVLFVQPAISLTDRNGQRTVFRVPPVGARVVVGPAIRFR